MAIKCKDDGNRGSAGQHSRTGLAPPVALLFNPPLYSTPLHLHKAPMRHSSKPTMHCIASFCWHGVVVKDTRIAPKELCSALTPVVTPRRMHGPGQLLLTNQRP